MIVYLTVADAFSGVYSSQVIEVVRHLRDHHKCNIKLVSFVSLRKFFSERKKIKGRLHDATVLPMYPKLENWEKNELILSFLLRNKGVLKIIARGPFATNLALRIRDKGIVQEVVFDGRGAYATEGKE